MANEYQKSEGLTSPFNLSRTRLRSGPKAWDPTERFRYLRALVRAMDSYF